MDFPDKCKDEQTLYRAEVWAQGSNLYAVCVLKGRGIFRIFTTEDQRLVNLLLITLAKQERTLSTVFKSMVGDDVINAGMGLSSSAAAVKFAVRTLTTTLANRGGKWEPLYDDVLTMPIPNREALSAFNADSEEAHDAALSATSSAGFNDTDEDFAARRRLKLEQKKRARARTEKAVSLEESGLAIVKAAHTEHRLSVKNVAVTGLDASGEVISGGLVVGNDTRYLHIETSLNNAGVAIHWDFNGQIVGISS